MRKTILLGALLAFAATACKTTTPNSNANLPASNANTAASTPTPAQTVSAKDIIDKENQVFDAIKRKDWDAFAKFLSDDQLYVTNDGVHDRAATLNAVKKLDITEFSLADAKVVNVDKDLVVVTYTSNVKGSYDGKPMPPTSLRESSAWANRYGTWLIVYHQDSEVQTAPPSNPTVADTPTAPGGSEVQTRGKPPTAASPAPAPATPTDVEKQIWDALKRKDWDAFASMLAADAVEVEPSAVRDKQGTVGAVKQLDFSRVTLSDFKEVKIDADAALVTYVVRGAEPSPKGYRHTTIQNNRGGKWLAVFHQGTQIK